MQNDGADFRTNVIEKLAGGRFVVILENLWGGENNDSFFPVYGLQRGLDCVAETTEDADNGGWNFTLAETGLPMAGLYYWHTDEETSRNDLDALAGGGGAKIYPKDVNFYDYDGTLVQSYTKAEALALTALPALPNHTAEGLTAVEWNWSLADIVDYYNHSGGIVNIGATMTPTDGNSHIIAEVPQPMWVSLNITATVANAVTVDWGDGSSIDTWETTSAEQKVHKYTDTGRFDIRIMCSSGNWSSYNLGGNIVNADGTIGNSTYQNALNPFVAIFFGNHVNIGNNMLTQSSHLSAVVLPATITDAWNAYGYCTGLTAIILPKTVSVMRTFAAGQIVSMPEKINMAYGIASGTQNIGGITIPLSTNLRSSSISTIYALSRLDIPDSYTSIAASAFATVPNILEYHLYATTPPTLANVNAFPVTAGTKIYVPSASLTAYQTASVWSGLASYMVGE